MVIVRELPTDIPFKEVEKIYEKGNKIAIALNKPDVVGYTDCVCRFTKEGSAVEDFDNSTPTSCIEGICPKGEDITFVGDGTLVVIDRVSSGHFEQNLEFKPFTGAKSEYVCSFCAYVDGKMADRVVEVTV